MKNLSDIKCEACRADAPLVTKEEMDEYLPMIPEWGLVEEDRVQKLTRTFRTSNYKETIRFVNGIADLAESEGHHPLLLVDYRSVTVWWWSHKIKGLHLNDFVMSAKTNGVFRNLS